MLKERLGKVFAEGELVPVDAKRELINAIKMLLAHDDGLLRRDVNERTLTHRLALYMEPLFLNVEGESWNVDCEYNRNHYEAKLLRIDGRAGPRRTTDEDDSGTTVYPDIIVHERDSNERNLLVVEVKKTTSRVRQDFDIAKLMAFRRAPFRYATAAFLLLNTERGGTLGRFASRDGRRTAGSGENRALGEILPRDVPSKIEAGRGALRRDGARRAVS